MTNFSPLLMPILLLAAQPAEAAETLGAAPTVAEALRAYRANKVSEAEGQLRSIADATDSSPDDRATALAELGRIDWLLRGSTAGADRAKSDRQAARSCAVRILSLRIMLDQHKPSDTANPAERPTDCSALQASDLAVLDARTRVAFAISRGRAPDLLTAERTLDALPAATQRSLDVARARLTLGIASHDPQAALRGWRDYFWLDTVDAPSGLKSYAGRVKAIFRSGAARGAATRDKAILAMLLVRAGFVDEAAMLAKGHTGPDWRAVNAGIKFDSALKATLLSVNRSIAAGGKVENLAQRVTPFYDALARDAGLTGHRDAAILETFGIFGTDPGETDGFPSIHVGRLVQDERMRVSQYGRSGEVRFVVVDNMISNGFEGWLWDGWGQTGGWSNDSGTIVQVRSAYVRGTIDNLDAVRPGAARDEYIATTEKSVAAELAVLRSGAVGPLAATSRRLKLRALDEIASKTKGDTGFLAEVWRGTNQTSIESHEGRHALDHAELPNLSSEDLEFRAKLSQIIFADYPRLGLSAVAGSTLSNTAHGQADRRVLEGYRAWMGTHSREVAGFEPGVPGLAQLPRLTDQQIVEIARGMDPWGLSGGGGARTAR